MSTLLEGLAGLQSGLEDLLACFEANAFPDLAGLDANGNELQRRFASVCSQLGDGGAANAPEIRARLERCLRLYAVAAGMLVRRRDELVLERAACSAARSRLRRMKAAAQSGASCDVRA